jgi:hypothetical protein
MNHCPRETVIRGWVTHFAVHRETHGTSASLSSPPARAAAGPTGALAFFCEGVFHCGLQLGADFPRQV